MRPARFLAALAIVVGSGLSFGLGGAGAGEAVPLDDLGWWSRLNQDPTLSPVVAATPDVAPGQLLVEGTPEGATSIAAIRATIPAGTGNPVLHLAVASDTGGAQAVLLACQAGSGWTGVHGGTWSAKPSPDCGQSVQGLPSEDGSEWTFAIGGLQFGDQVNVVLTPGLTAEGGPSSSFRLVFDVPAEVLTVTETRAAPPVSMPAVVTTAPPAAQSPAPTPSAPTATSAFSPVPAPRPPTSAALAAQPAQAALPTTEQGLTATAPVLRAASAPPPLPLPDVDRNDGRVFGVVVVLAGLATLYWSTTQELPERRVLSRFAAGGAAVAAAPVSAPSAASASDADDRVGGLGRFRRVRDTPARRLGT